ncbi:flagellar biosynthesis protein [Desulfallas sp. Bu1-1]|uniref:FliH/SctL family protein n=1 Tax=Desulfallas sp. Bu1-1 TaxID=2787620 RepID=UPI00189E6C3D|nr:FliH/SctL family protein [Desulfallas sp. Bu1-1]MBF7081962.1 flagellar biosynthesis protein [Desulfallas sp. Bu1-1]
MPLLHKIIRHGGNGSGSLQGMYDLNIRHEFLFVRQEGEQIQAKQEWDANPDQLIEKARREAGAIVDAAREQAASIIEQARQEAIAEAEKIKSAAAREGYDRGYREALEAARIETEKIMAGAGKVLAQAEQVRREKLTGLKDEILELALEIAEKILARELELHPDIVLNVAGEALQLVTNRKSVVLWVNPEDLQICENHRERLLNHLPPRAELQILTDEQIERGGCVVETDFGKVDARITAKWENLISAIKGEST